MSVYAPVHTDIHLCCHSRAQLAACKPTCYEEYCDRHKFGNASTPQLVQSVLRTSSGESTITRSMMHVWGYL